MDHQPSCSGIDQSLLKWSSAPGAITVADVNNVINVKVNTVTVAVGYVLFLC